METATPSPLSNELIKQLMPWVRRQVKPYTYFGVDNNDLVQECLLTITEHYPVDLSGSIGRAKAYLTPFVRRALLDYSFQNQRAISPGKSRKIQSTIISLRAQMVDGKISSSARRSISETIGLSTAEVDSWANYINGEDVDCYELVGSEIPKTPDLLELMSWSVLEAQITACHQALVRLNKNERQMIEMRYLNDDVLTLRDAGQAIQVGTTRAWQIEKSAIAKIAAVIENLASGNEGVAT